MLLQAGENARMSGRLSSKALQAAAKVRRRNFEEQLPKGAPGIFVVRRVGLTQAFGWEIRRYGSFVVSRGDEGSATQVDVRAAGEKALTALSSI